MLRKNAEASPEHLQSAGRFPHEVALASILTQTNQAERRVPGHGRAPGASQGRSSWRSSCAAASFEGCLSVGRSADAIGCSRMLQGCDSMQQEAAGCKRESQQESQQDISRMSAVCGQDVSRMSAGCCRDANRKQRDVSGKVSRKVRRMSAGCRQDVSRMSAGIRQHATASSGM